MSASASGLDRAFTPRMGAFFVVLAAGATALGYGAVATLALPFLIGCALLLLGTPYPFIAIALVTSGLGFGWVTGASIALGDKTVNVSGLHWGLMFIVSAIALVFSPGRAVPAEWKPYLVFVGLCALGIGWSPDRFEGIKLFVQFLVPATVGLLSLRVLRDWSDVERLRGFFWLGLALALAGVAVVEAGALARTGAGGVAGTLSDRSFAVYLVPLLALAVASARHRHPAFTVLAAALVILATITLSRMVVATMLVLILAAALGARMRTRVMLTAATVVLTLAVLQVPSFRARMFNNQRVGFGQASIEVRGEGQDAALAVGGLQLSGRGLLWLQTGRHALERPVTGWGTGASRYFLVNENGLDIHHPHNDYLRVFHDLGVIGLALVFVFTAVIAWQLLRAYRRMRSWRSREATLAALLAWLGYLLLALTDNVMVYPTFFTVNVFILLAIAVRARELDESVDPERDEVTTPIAQAVTV